MTEVSFAPSLCLTSPNCVKILDSDGAIQYFNADGLRQMEIDDLSIVQGCYWPALWPDESLGLLEDALNGARSVGVATVEAFCPTAKGTPKWWNVTIATLPGAAGQYVVISRDITSERVARQAADKHNERLNLITASNPDVMWDIDLTTDAVWWSEGITDIFGYAREEVGDTIRWRDDRIHVDDRDRVLSSLRQIIDEGGTTWEAEFRFESASGEYLAVLDRGAITRDPSGTPLRFVGIMQDNSARQSAADLHSVVAAEYGHRVNNLLAVISGLFHTSVHTSADKEGLARTFNGRLAAMASAQAAVIRGAGLSADLNELARHQLAPYTGSGRIVIEGASVSVPAEVAQPLALSLNELATNALKYGALSNDVGRVHLRWSVDAAQRLVVEWTETGGPTVSPPTRKGMGTRLIEGGISRASVEKSYAAQGFSCQIAFDI